MYNINILQIALSLQIISIKHIKIKINVYLWKPCFKKGDNWNANLTHPFVVSWSAIIGPTFSSRGHDQLSSEQNNRKLIISTTMARTKNMHMDLQISSCWEHISTWNMHELLSKGTTVFQMNFQGKICFTQNWCNINIFISSALAQFIRYIFIEIYISLPWN